MEAILRNTSLYLLRRNLMRDENDVPRDGKERPVPGCVEEELRGYLECGLLWLLSPDYSEPCAAVPAVRLSLVSLGGTGTERAKVPGASTNDTLRTQIWTGRIACWRHRIGVVRVPIRAPLEGISVHVVQPEGIGLGLPHRRREHIVVAGPDHVFPVWDRV